MKSRLFALAAFAVGAGLPMAPAAAAPGKVTAATDWTRTVALTPADGYRMGNPAAKVKLVEYGSLTCPHCAHFAAESSPALRNYVRSGKVSYEYRNFVLNGLDVAATLLARCGGAKGFFAIADALYASQPKWMGEFGTLSSEQQTELDALPKDKKLARFVEIGGLYPIAARGGVSAEQGRQCVTDPSGLDRIAKLHESAVALGVHGTPAFFINGDKVDGVTWEVVEPKIRAALGGG